MRRDLAGHRLVAADTNVFIYHLDAHPQYGPAVARLFDLLERERIHLVTSAVTMLELLLKPLRDGSNRLAAEIYAGLMSLRTLEFVPLNVELAARAADLRARHRLSVPDSIQLATAVTTGATAFVCHDERLAETASLETGMHVFRADDLVRFLGEVSPQTPA